MTIPPLGAVKGSPQSAKVSGGKVRVMIVDDSLVVRGILRKTLLSDPEVEVVAAVGNGKLALEQLDKTEVDAVILDIEMPVMDGLTALPLMLKKKPDLVVLVASTLSQKNADISLKCLELGAKDYVPKPTTSTIAADENSFKRELLEKLKNITGALRRKAALRATTSLSSTSSISQGNPTFKTSPHVTQIPTSGKDLEKAQAAASNSYPLRPLLSKKPKALVVGCSTGGPQALAEFFRNAKNSIHIPVFVTQHMPPMFTKSLAAHIGRVSGIESAEAIDGEVVVSGRIYVAPGDYHMGVVLRDDKQVIKLTKDPPENYCRPSVNPILRTSATAYRGAVLGVMLTGLGNDGLQGAQDLIDAGGSMLTQDEASSVVWGMPGAVTKAGLSSGIFPIKEIFAATKRVLDAINPALGVRF